MVIAVKELFDNNANSIFNKAFRYQILATITVHIMTFSHGIGVGWSSPTLQKLQSQASPLGFTVSIAEGSWIVSFFGLGSLTGNILFGILLEKLGRKWSMYLLALPHMLLWILIYFAQNVEYLYAARFFGGITNGSVYIVMPIFIIEISNASIRGALSSMTMLFMSFGVLVGYVLSSHLDYYLIPCTIIVLPIIYLIAGFMFPETPQYLLKTGKIEQAEKSYKFYNNIKRNGDISLEDQKKCVEFDELKEAILHGPQASKITIKDFVNKPTLKAALTALILIIQNQFSGWFAFINYMSAIFTQSGTSMDPNTCTIIMGVVQILGTCVAAVLVDRFGRKVLLFVSTGGMSLGMIVFGAFTQLASVDDMKLFDWLPLVLMTFVVFLANIGVTFVIVVEIFPAKVRSRATAICMTVTSCLMFVTLKLYPFFLYNLGISTTMFSCAGVCVVCLFYYYFFLEETKGKSMDYD